ncbi:alpha/beta hydrolase [Priestia aryabhattai]|uniref:alpha/beta fold hydrolase n=1 Tax=Priestia aryabhattai TaxID=412384 RepID=UPI003D298D78
MTLTGLGDRNHLLTPNINLKTHITDVVNTILFENLDTIYLVGHSYGGGVIIGAADQLLNRISKLIFFDALILEDNQSINDLYSESFIKQTKEIVQSKGEGFKLPKPDSGSIYNTDHPFKTFEQKIKLMNKAELRQIPRAFINCTEKSGHPVLEPINQFAEKAKQEKWEYIEISAGHNAHWEKPVELAKKFINLTDKNDVYNMQN